MGDEQQKPEIDVGANQQSASPSPPAITGRGQETSTEQQRPPAKEEKKGLSGEELPKKKGLKAFSQAIVDVMKPVGDDTLRIVAAFFLVVCLAIVMAAILPWSRAVAIIALVLIAAVFLAVIVYVWLKQKLPARSQTAPSPQARTRFRILRAILSVFIVFLSAATPVAVDRLQLVQKALPDYFPEFAATQGLRNHFSALTDLLRARTDSATLAAFARYAESTTGGFQQRLFRGHSNVVQLLQDYHAGKPEATGPLLGVAGSFKDAYGKIDNLFVEYTTRASWRPIKLGTVSEAIFQAVIRYEGKFTFNRYNDPRFTVARLGRFLDPSTLEAKELLEWLGANFKKFNSLSEEEKKSIVAAIRLDDLTKPNLLDVLAFRFSALGTISEEAFREGREVSWYSVEMQRENGKGSIWKVAQLAPWGTYRMPFSDIIIKP